MLLGDRVALDREQPGEQVARRTARRVGLAIDRR